MRLHELLTESTARTLYHGTLRRFLPSILQHGLLPSLGEFRRKAYAESEAAGIELPEMVFAADKQGLYACVGAISGALEAVGLADTAENFFRHGAIVVIRQGENKFGHLDRDDENDGTHPETVEPGDYYTDYPVRVDYAVTGNDLRRFLRRHGEIVDRDRRSTVAALIRMARRRDPGGSREAQIAQVRGLSDAALQQAWRRARYDLDDEMF